MNSIQKKLLELLKEFDQICRENNIKYVVCGGNALGQERHGGFIPWDDDVDLFITRQEYNKLDKLLSANIRRERAWITKENSPYYCDPIPRYVDLTTTNFVRGRLSDETPQGQMVELFILDPYPNDKLLRAQFEKYLWLYCELLNPYYVIAGSQLASDIVDESLYRKYSNRIRKEGKEKILKEIEDKYLTYDYDECDLLCARFGGKAPLVKKEWMDKIEYRRFEDTELPFFIDNIEYLYEMEYGYNWNISPLKSNQVAHSDVLIINDEIPYTKHIDHIEEMCTRYDLKTIQLQNKIDTLEKRFSLLKYQKIVANVKNSAVKAMIAEIEAKREDLPADDHDYCALIFQNIFSILFNTAYKKWNIEMEMSDEMFDLMFRTLVYKDRIDQCKSLIKQTNNDNNDYYNFIVDTIAQLKIAKYKEDTSIVHKLLSQIKTIEGMEKQPEVERCSVWYTQKTDTTRKSREEILNFYEDIYNQKDPEIRKYIGDYFLKNGEIVEASKWYKSVSKTRNGMIKKDMLSKGFY